MTDEKVRVGDVLGMATYYRLPTAGRADRGPLRVFTGEGVVLVSTTCLSPGGRRSWWALELAQFEAALDLQFAGGLSRSGVLAAMWEASPPRFSTEDAGHSWGRESHAMARRVYSVARRHSVPHSDLAALLGYMVESDDEGVWTALSYRRHASLLDAQWEEAELDAPARIVLFGGSQEVSRGARAARRWLEGDGPHPGFELWVGGRRTTFAGLESARVALAAAEAGAPLGAAPVVKMAHTDIDVGPVARDSYHKDALDWMRDVSQAHPGFAHSDGSRFSTYQVASAHVERHGGELQIWGTPYTLPCLPSNQKADSGPGGPGAEVTGALGSAERAALTTELGRLPLNGEIAAIRGALSMLVDRVVGAYVNEFGREPALPELEALMRAVGRQGGLVPEAAPCRVGSYLEGRAACGFRGPSGPGVALPEPGDGCLGVMRGGHVAVVAAGAGVATLAVGTSGDHSTAVHLDRAQVGALVRMLTSAAGELS